MVADVGECYWQSAHTGEPCRTESTLTGARIDASEWQRRGRGARFSATAAGIRCGSNDGGAPMTGIPHGWDDGGGGERGIGAGDGGIAWRF